VSWPLRAAPRVPSGRGARVTGLLRRFRDLGRRRSPVAGSEQVKGHFPQDHRKWANRTSRLPGPLQGGGRDARELSLPPAWPCLPGLNCRHANQGDNYRPSPRPCEPPEYGAEHPPDSPPSLPDSPLLGVPRSTSRILTVTREGGELRGEAPGTAGKFPRHLPNPASLPLTSAYTREEPGSRWVIQRPLPTRGSAL
jgi:hypothetical protein